MAFCCNDFDKKWPSAVMILIEMAFCCNDFDKKWPSAVIILIRNGHSQTEFTVSIEIQHCLQNMLVIVSCKDYNVFVITYNKCVCYNL